MNRGRASSQEGGGGPFESRFLGSSAAARDIRRAILQAARATKTTVLVTGESGVGKELVARSIHEASARAEGPFVAVNCASIPENLIESELFGHERGSFTDAVAEHRGAFQRADGGTLLLDEIGDLSGVAQPKLLRALETGEVVRVGSERPIDVDIRVIAATNQDLEAMCRERRFREDLFYRLSVLDIHVPPLRERLEDIPVLVEHFMSDLTAEMGGRRRMELGREGLRALQGFSWPGNVRQLRSAVERAVALHSGGRLGAEAFNGRGTVTTAPGGNGNVEHLLERDWRGAREGFARLYATALLDRHEGKVERAARAAGLAPGSLYKILRRLGLRPGARPPS